MNTLKLVRLKHAWQQWPKGHVFTAMPAAQAQHMIAAGQAEYVEDDPVTEAPRADYADTQIAAAPADRMMRNDKRSRRQPPRNFL
jgi:hypothetical protein